LGSDFAFSARADFVGCHIPDKFVVGCGLDYRERYRNLPYIATLKPDATTNRA